MRITAIAAIDEAGVIGVGGKLPWHLPDDLRRFRELTMNRPVIMGRTTYESLPGPLDGRCVIVPTRDRRWAREGAIVAVDLNHALRLANDYADSVHAHEIMVAGGQTIYQQFAGTIHRLHLTLVPGVHGGAVDPIRQSLILTEYSWTIVGRSEGRGCKFVTLDRIGYRPFHGGLLARYVDLTTEGGAA